MGYIDSDFRINVKLPQLLEAGLHFGHKAHRWNPKMFRYIYTQKNNIHIIDLLQTAELLGEAMRFLAVEEQKQVLFIGTKRQASAIVKKAADSCSSPYVNRRWLGGMLTNFVTVRKRIGRLNELEEQIKTGVFDLLPKKEATVRSKELEKLRKYLSGVRNMSQLPDIAIIVDQKREMTAVKECRKLGIPIISIVDTNCDPDLIDYPIPGNDDSVRSIKFVLYMLANSIPRNDDTKVDLHPLMDK